MQLGHLTISGAQATDHHPTIMASIPEAKEASQLENKAPTPKDLEEEDVPDPDEDDLDDLDGM